jgi:hypothetical protein
MSNTISTGYNPREHQLILHNLRRKFRFLVSVCHRRFGKTVGYVNDTIDDALTNPLKNPQYAYIMPTFGQAKRVCWDYFKEYTEVIPGAVPNEADLRIDIPRGKDRIRFMLLGSENLGSLKGLYLDGAVLDEYSEMNPLIWREVIRPALADRHTLDPRYGWGVFSGTPKGENHFFEMYNFAMERKNWHSIMFKASETKIIPQEELDEARAEMGEELYNQEFECSFTSNFLGSYYGKYMGDLTRQGRISDQYSYDPALPVYTAFDLGIGDTTAVWFVQQNRNSVVIIDYMEEAGRGLEWWVKEIKDKPYAYEEHIVPHDANARELGTGKTRIELMRSFGLGRIKLLPRWSLADGINAVRLLLPRCYFSTTCDYGIRSLKNYCRKWDAKENRFMDHPKHDWASHGADAFRYLAMGLRSDFGKNKSLPRAAEMDYDEFSM